MSPDTFFISMRAPAATIARVGEELKAYSGGQRARPPGPEGGCRLFLRTAPPQLPFVMSIGGQGVTTARLDGGEAVLQRMSEMMFVEVPAG